MARATTWKLFIDTPHAPTKRQRADLRFQTHLQRFMYPRRGDNETRGAEETHADHVGHPRTNGTKPMRTSLQGTYSFGPMEVPTSVS